MPHEARQVEHVNTEAPEHVVGEATSVAHDDAFVPYWLLVLVGVLLLAVLGAGGYIAVILADRSNAARLNAASPGHEDGIASWQQKVAADATDVPALVSLGYAYQDEERFAEAVERYDDALEIDERNLGALYNRGLCLSELGDDDAAEAAFAAVLEVSPEHVLAAKMLGSRYMATERYSLIASAVASAADANPEMADLRALMGVAHEHAGDRAKAIAEYREALRHAPGLPLAKQGLRRLEGGPE